MNTPSDRVVASASIGVGAGRARPGTWRRRAAAVVALVLGVAAAPHPAAAGAPMEELHQRVDRVVAVLAEKQDPERRRQAIRTAADEIFAFEETAKRALGRHWNQRTPEQRAEFTRLFTDLLERAYVGKLDQYSGERITWLGDSMDGDTALVRSKFTTKQGTDIPIDYRMLRTADRWRVYDVVIEGVSLVSNYRQQFDRIIETASYDELVSRMRARAVAPPPGRRS